MTNQIRDAFKRVAKQSPALSDFQLYRRVDPDDYADMQVTEEQGRSIIQTGLYDWVETLPGALHWNDFGADGNGSKGVLDLYGEPSSPALVLATDGEWYAVEETLGADSLRVGYRLEVKRWPHDDLPNVREVAP